MKKWWSCHLNRGKGFAHKFRIKPVEVLTITYLMFKVDNAKDIMLLERMTSRENIFTIGL